jgi:hypothetical protein
MDKPSVPMTQQLIKRTRGNMSEEQMLESHLMRKAAKLQKQALPDRTVCGEDQVGLLHDVLVAACGFGKLPIFLSQ